MGRGAGHSKPRSALNLGFVVQELNGTESLDNLPVPEWCSNCAVIVVADCSMRLWGGSDWFLLGFIAIHQWMLLGPDI